MNDDAPEAEITDVTSDCAGKLESIEYITESDLEPSLKSLKEAAAEARNNERRISYGGKPIPNGLESTSGDYEWVDERFKKFFERWPSTVEAMAGHCEEAKQPLTKGQMTAFGLVDTAVDRWGGDSQKHFRKYFVDPFPQAVTNQQAALEELRVGLLAYAGVLRKGRLNARAIADQTTNALDGLGEGIFGDDGGEVALAVIAAAAGIAGAAVSGGTSLTVTLAIIGGGAGVAGGILAKKNDEGPKVTITGDDVEGVLQSMQNTLDDLQSEMESAERAIASSWESSSGEISGHVAAGGLEKATMLPNEPTDDGIPNLTSGDEVSTHPEDGDFRPRT